MEGVQFEEDDPILNPQYVAAQRARTKKTGSIIALVIRLKLAKDERQANIVLLVAAIIILVIAGGLLYVNVIPRSSPPPLHPGMANPDLRP